VKRRVDGALVVEGNTYPLRSTFRALGFEFDREGKQWVLESLMGADERLLFEALERSAGENGLQLQLPREPDVPF